MFLQKEPPKGAARRRPERDIGKRVNGTFIAAPNCDQYRRKVWRAEKCLVVERRGSAKPPTNMPAPHHLIFLSTQSSMIEITTGPDDKKERNSIYSTPPDISSSPAATQHEAITRKDCCTAVLQFSKFSGCPQPIVREKTWTSTLR